MYILLIGVAIAVLVWGSMWQRQPKMAMGVLLGLPIAWIISRLIEPYVSGMEQVPVWLPPLPFALVAILLFSIGTWIWFRGAPAVRQGDDESSTHH